MVYPSFAVIEKALGSLPGKQEIENDLKDHWTSRRHLGEHLRLIHRLFEFSLREKTRVTPDRDEKRIWANWLCEGEEEPFTKVIHPV